MTGPMKNLLETMQLLVAAVRTLGGRVCSALLLSCPLENGAGVAAVAAAGDDLLQAADSDGLPVHDEVDLQAVMTGSIDPPLMLMS